jgi:chromosome segregation ATPase
MLRPGEISMENEKLEKRIKWLDDERRKDKAIISELEDRLIKLEGKLEASENKQKEFDSDMTRVRAAIVKVDDFENGLSDFKLERKKYFKDYEKDVKSWINDAKKMLKTQIQGVETQQKKTLDDFKLVKDLDKEMKTRIDEETRLTATLREMESNFDDIKRDYKEYQRESKSVRDERKKEAKRIADVQGEGTALRKRVDELRGLVDLVNSDYQKINNRIQELESIRRELKKEQDTFLEEAALQSTERETIWKNWMTRFDTVEKQAQDLDEQMAKLDSTHRGVKRMQDELKELSTLLDRRVNEITEMQRLADERFRAEWATFTADDQKRWTNYTLAQKEQSKLLERQYKDGAERLEVLEDSLQEIGDQLAQLSSYSETQLQGLLNMLRDWAAEFEGIMDGFR